MAKSPVTPAAHRSYMRDQILNASPEKIIVLLYDGAIKSLDESRQHIQDADPFRFTELVINAQQIISELIGALKVDIYPELVINLSRLYEFMYQHLVRAQLEKNEEKINQVIHLLKGLRDSWKEAIDKAKDEAAASAGATQAAPAPVAKPAPKPSLSFQA